MSVKMLKNIQFKIILIFLLLSNPIKFLVMYKQQKVREELELSNENN